MAQKGAKSSYINEYLSYQNCGVNITQFYYDMGTNMFCVSKETGISRQALARFVVYRASDDTNNIVVRYLEEKIIKDYQETTRQNKRKIESLRQKVNAAWELYLKREELLEEYRKKHHVERKHPMERRVTEEEIFEKS